MDENMKKKANYDEMLAIIKLQNNVLSDVDKLLDPRSTTPLAPNCQEARTKIMKMMEIVKNCGVLS